MKKLKKIHLLNARIVRESIFTVKYKQEFYGIKH